ncbi:MAG: phage head morphogenesis protein [Deltaproteobacteria bacterium]|nr:MAG: phage head morphogenesis protein [Deltaproteobacteria bacterium]
MPNVTLNPLPFEEAIAYFRSKGFALTGGWTELWQELHALSFTVAQVAKLDILTDIREAVDQALANGTTLKQFQAELEPLLRKKGWWGQTIAESGATIQLGSLHRLRTIFNTNIQTAYQVGHYQQMSDPDVIKMRPYWRYVAVNDGRTRPQHKAWHGLILRHDDPFWNTHYPPNGWGCRCTVVTVSEREIERDKQQVADSPEIETYEWIDKKTGEIHRVPVGIDPGWAYNPGKAAFDPNLKRYAPDLQEKFNGAAGT